MIDKKNKSETINYDRIIFESTIEVLFLYNQNVLIVVDCQH